MNKKDFFEDLQLLSLVLSEEVGELVKAINNYVWKKGTLEEIYKEAQDISPVLLSIFNTVRILKNKEKEKE